MGAKFGMKYEQIINGEENWDIFSGASEADQFKDESGCGNPERAQKFELDTRLSELVPQNMRDAEAWTRQSGLRNNGVLQVETRQYKEP